MNKSANKGMNGTAAAHSAHVIGNQQFSMYRTKGGGGFAAEDANALDDFFRGKTVVKCGVDRSKNGADRISGGVSIQSKYCRDAYHSVNNAFDGAHGQYRYPGQVLEVPKDQYDACVQLMQDKIRNGQVPDVSDPSKAKDLVKRGNYTYEETLRMSKVGTVDSIIFDIKSQSVTCLCAAGLSAVVSYVSARRKGNSSQKAAKIAAKEAGYGSMLMMVAGVSTQQFLRTSVGRATEKAIENAVESVVKEACKSSIGRAAVARVAIGAAGKQAATETGKRVAIASAKSTVTSMAKNNIITGTVMTVATSVPDALKVCQGKMSGKEFAKNTTSRAAGVAGGSAGWTIGASIGSIICPGIGTAVGALTVSVICGAGASSAVHHLLGKFGL